MFELFNDIVDGLFYIFVVIVVTAFKYGGFIGAAMVYLLPWLLIFGWAVRQSFRKPKADDTDEKDDKEQSQDKP